MSGGGEPAAAAAAGEEQQQQAAGEQVRCATGGRAPGTWRTPAAVRAMLGWRMPPGLCLIEAAQAAGACAARSGARQRSGRLHRCAAEPLSPHAAA